MQASLRPSNPVFSEAKHLEYQLTGSGLRVECLLNSKMESFFAGERGAALFRTTAGDFEVLFLAGGRSFDSLVIHKYETSGRYVYSFEGTPRAQSSIDSSIPTYFVKRGNQLFIVTSAKLAENLGHLS
ncbi:MAG TPA: hypothetical protein VG897_03605 [Terriglobales bacterium]|nr:hypothetical protein [Terriglobales bacterium]